MKKQKKGTKVLREEDIFLLHDADNIYVPLEIIRNVKVPLPEKTFFGMILSSLHPTNGCTRTYEDIGKTARVSARTVRRWAKHLQELEYIETHTVKINGRSVKSIKLHKNFHEKHKRVSLEELGREFAEQYGESFEQGEQRW